MVINESEAKIVRRIFNSYLHEGKGYFAIAKQLNEENIPSRFNKEWSLRSIKLLLSNPVYKGTLVWNRVNSSKKKRQEKEEEEWVIVDDCLPAIIDKETWEAVQNRLNKKQIPSRAQSSPHLLGGLLKCGNCGGGMSISWSGSKNNRYRVYRCSNNKNKGTCTSKQYKADQVEAWFKQGLLQLTKNFSSEILLKLSEQTTHNRDLNIEQKIRSAKVRYNRKVEAYTAGLIEIDDLTEEKMRMEHTIEALQRGSKKSDVDLVKLQKNIEKKLKNVVDAVETLPVEDGKALLSTIVEKVILKGEKEMEIGLIIF